MSKMYCIILSDSIDKMERELRNREYRKGTDIPITVGILVADYRRRFCQENIIDQIDRLNKKTGELIDFYIPGYEKTLQYECFEIAADNRVEYNGEKYRFSSEKYNDFLDALEKKGIKVTGRTQLLLVPFENGHLWFKDTLMFDLEKSEEVERVGSVKLFFDYLIKISRETTDFEVFRKTIRYDMKRSAFLEFLKDKLKDSLWAVFVPS